MARARRIVGADVTDHRQAGQRRNAGSGEVGAADGGGSAEEAAEGAEDEEDLHVGG